MHQMSIRVILNSGSEFTIKCDKFTLERNGFGQATGYNKPVYLNFDQVAAIVRVQSDEVESDEVEEES